MNMVLKDEAQGSVRERSAARLRFGLTARLVPLILGFVVIAEIAIYVPAIVSFRNAWLQNRLSAAYTATLALETAPTPTSSKLALEILRSIGARSIALQLPDSRRLVAAARMPTSADDIYDMRNWTPFEGVIGAFKTMFAPPNAVLRAIGPAPMGGDYVEITLDEGPLRAAMLSVSVRILAISAGILLLIAAVAAAALHLMVLAPVRRLTSSLIAFGANPEDPTRIIRPSNAAHEIGAAERALALVQKDLLNEFNQKKRLAALGLAVAKINHDMRNMLAPAQLLSDRLADVSDPLARRLAPKLVTTIDRAIRFCQSTLAYGRAAERPPRPERANLRGLVADAAETVSPEGIGAIPIHNETPVGLDVEVDPEQTFRIFLNLLRNAVDALEGAGPQPGRAPLVRVRAAQSRRDFVTVEISDTGPGVPERAKEHLFEAFQGSTRVGGSGLGLAIASELVRAQGGAIRLEEPPEGGACFIIDLPAPP